MTNITKDCICLNQGGVDIVIFSTTAKEMSKFAEVNRRDSDKDKGYQRMFSPSRIKAIADYIKSNKQVPTSILLSIDGAKLSQDKSKVIIPSKKKSAWIIDGQHRYLGALDADTDIELPVVAFLNLPVEKQIEQFVTINKESKGVPTSLYLDLLGSLPKKLSPTEQAKERAVDIASDLRKDESSAFHQRIAVVQSPKSGQISLTNFVRKTQSLFVPEKGRLADFVFDNQKKVIDNYFTAIKHKFPDEWKSEKPIFFQTIGFGAFMNAFEMIFLQTTNRSNGGFSVADIEETFANLDKLDFESWRQYGTGSSAENTAANDVKALITAFEEGDGISLRL